MESFSLRNIKGFLDTGDIDLKPLTIFIGMNSSGKSSIVRFPVVLKQTFIDDSVAPLLFAGRSVDYGNFEDVVLRHETSRKIEFEFTLNINEFNNSFKYFPSKIKKKMSFLLDVENMRVIVSIAQDRNGFLRVIEFKLQSEISKKDILSIILDGKRYKYILNEVEGGYFDQKYIFDKFLPEWFSLFENNVEEQYFAINMFFRTLHQHIQELTASINYIGPFRHNPERIYRYKENAISHVGKDGEFAPVLLVQDRKLKGDLIKQVSNWLEQYLNMQLSVEDFSGQEVDVNSDMFRIMITDLSTNVKNNLTDVGHGLSQLIPIVVQVLNNRTPKLSSKQNITIIEQPELHLHPSAQACLIDLFLLGLKRNSKQKKKFLIETHSEHLLLRLRRYIVEGKININDIAIYYTYKDSENNLNKVNKLRIDEFGSIENWPEGFFEEDYVEALAYRDALIKKRGEGEPFPW